jgi:hypothetical protein
MFLLVHNSLFRSNAAMSNLFVFALDIFVFSFSAKLDEQAGKQTVKTKMAIKKQMRFITFILSFLLSLSFLLDSLDHIRRAFFLRDSAYS